MDWVLAQLAAPASIGATALALALLYRNLPTERRIARSLATAVLAGIVGCAVWLAFGPVRGSSVLPALEPSLTALAGLAAVLATLAIREAGKSLAAVLVFAAVWTATVFVPVAIAIYSSDGLLQRLGQFPLDHGGAVPALVASGAAVTAVLLLDRRMPHSAPALRSAGSVITAAVVVLVAWTGWLTSMELAIDQATPRILLNVALAGAFGVAGWLIVQRIHHDTATIAAAAAGLVSGLSAITAGAAYLDPLWAAVTGLVAAVLAAAFVHRRVRLSGRASWFVVGAQVIAPGIGLLLLGMFAEGIGMLFTGQPGFLVTEVLVAVSVFGYSLVVSAVLWIGVAFIPGGARRRSHARARSE